MDRSKLARERRRMQAEARQRVSAQAVHIRLIIELVRGAHNGLSHVWLADCYGLPVDRVQNLLAEWNSRQRHYKATLLSLESLGYKFSYFAEDRL